MKRKFSELENIRRNKIEKLRKLNHSPWGRNQIFTHDSDSFQQEFNGYSKEELEKINTKISLPFRVMTKRGPFLVGKDSVGSVQVYIGKNDLSDNIMAIIDNVDIGDILKVEGTPMKTKVNTLSVRATNIIFLSKALKPLPEKFHSLKDVEERYRRRYVDLIMNEDVKKIFWTRTKIISAIREFFDNLNYMEVETPVLQPILGGAAAKPFITHHNALDMPFYLRIATELPLKRLLVGGIDRVYEIGRIFRNEGIDTTHNPEFTSIEFYEAFSNNEGMMKRTEEVIAFIAKKLNKTSFKFRGKNISLKAPFARLDMVEAVNAKTNKDFKNISLDEAKKIAKKYNIKLQSYFTIGHIISELFEELVEDTIIQPTFVTGFPIEISPLAAKKLDDPRFTERAELLILGKEYANMFTELNDPIDQLERFEEQSKEREAGNDEANEIDMDFVEALEYGMPPAGGCGIGIDRLTMLITEQESIRDVLLFPHLKNRSKK